MNFLSKLCYCYKKILETIRLYLVIAGPGMTIQRPSTISCTLT